MASQLFPMIKYLSKKSCSMILEADGEDRGQRETRRSIEIATDMSVKSSLAMASTHSVDSRSIAMVC